jgi:hypothetical protein
MSTARKLAAEPVPGIRRWRHRIAEHDLRQGIEVSDDDRTVVTAVVTTSEGSGGTARVSLRAEPGHITPGRRVSLVDAVLDLPEVQESARVEAAFRLGDGESLHRLQERCQDVSSRPAGWSALVDANLPSGRAWQHVPGSAGKEPLPGA